VQEINSVAKCNEHGDFSSANECMQPAFAGSYKTIPSPKIPSEVGENGMSSGWICRWYKNTGEFVPFLWKVGENILEWVKLSIPPTSQMTMKNSPTHFCCFI